MAKKIIDVARYQGNIDWNKVKAAGIEGALQAEEILKGE